MRVLDVCATGLWLAEHGIRFVPATEWGTDHQLVFGARAATAYDIPTSTVDRLVLARNIGIWFQCTGALFVITVATGLRPEALDVFLDIRRHYGDMRWVDGIPGGATPGQVFDDAPHENRRTVTEIAFLMMALDLQGYLIEASGGTVLKFDDGYLWLESSREEAIRAQDEIAVHLQINRWAMP